MSEYNPRPAQAAILERALGYVQSVPYNVTARWLFYRLLQDGSYSRKSDYKRMIQLLSVARKRFYRGWQPDTLADDTREAVSAGFGYWNERTWAASFAEEECILDRYKDQPVYLELWFEAHAMKGQFEHYAPDIVLRPFGGDASIPFKWQTALDVANRCSRYMKDAVILYFGDLDPKGMTIPQSAWADVSAWIDMNGEPEYGVEFRRIALSPGDENRLNIMENPERPGTYQWEALEDDQAGALIADAIAPYRDEDALKTVMEREQEATEKFQAWLPDAIKKVFP